MLAKRCVKCGEQDVFLNNCCIDCWPGYNLCKACGDYRCEHLTPDANDLLDPDYTSCHCENRECRTGFVEGSERRIITTKEFRALIDEWEHAGLKLEERDGQRGSDDHLSTL